MPTYLSPGVYVEEIPSGSAPIAGLSTSTAGFIGVLQNSIEIPKSSAITVTETFTLANAQGSNTNEFNLTRFPVNLKVKPKVVVVVDTQTKETKERTAKLELPTPDEIDKKAKVILEGETLKDDQELKVTYTLTESGEENEAIITIEKGKKLDKNIEKELEKYPVNLKEGTYTIKFNNKKLDDQTGVTISKHPEKDVAVLTIPKEKITNDPDLYDDNQGAKKEIIITVDYQVQNAKFPSSEQEKKDMAEVNDVKLCTNFNEFKKYFGDFPSNDNLRQFALAVYGFFNNGGSRCYVSRIKSNGNVTEVLEKFEAIDEIAIVAAPGIVDPPSRSAIVTHCRKMGDRFAILDCVSGKSPNDVKDDQPANSDYAGYYYPWIKVFDPVKKIMNPNGKGEDFYTSVPPSGHIAGVYARVDAGRGVHKAPANEVIFGALGLDYKISQSQQDGLNPDGINCIRELNGNIRIWGARTVGGNANGEFKYINVRRLFLSLRDSIDKGTQWTVFEPNDAELWAKIRRNVNAYLTNVWRSGALFGASPQEAFFVKCDAENNPPEVRDLGQVIIEIGVAPVKPAEFVIFRLSQWANG